MPRPDLFTDGGRRTELATRPGDLPAAEPGDEARPPAARRPRRVRSGPLIWQPGNRRLNLALRILAPLVALAVWYGVVELYHIQPSLLPSPVEVAKALWSYAQSTMWSDSGTTLRVAVVGMLIGAAIGVVIGLLMGWDKRVRAAFTPLVAATFPIPKIAILSLLVIWFGIGDTSRIVLTVVGVFYIILINTLAAVDTVPVVLLMAATNLGAGRLAILYKVLLPSALPNIFASLRIAYSISLILVIAAEMQIPSTGVGSFINRSGQILDTSSVFAGLVLTGIFGVLGNFLITRIERLVMPWSVRR